MTESGVRRIRLGPLPDEDLHLRLEKIRWTTTSFQVLAFLNLPPARFESAAMDDPCFADAFFMYGAGQRADPSRDVYLTGHLKIRRRLIAAAGLPDDNELVLLTQSIDGERLHEDLLEFVDVLREPRKLKKRLGRKR